MRWHGLDHSLTAKKPGANTSTLKHCFCLIKQDMHKILDVLVSVVYGFNCRNLYVIHTHSRTQLLPISPMSEYNFEVCDIVPKFQMKLK